MEGTEWIERAKLRPKAIHTDKRYSVSVPTTPTLKSTNHFQVLSPPSSTRSTRKNAKKRRKTPQPLSPSDQVVPEQQQQQETKSLHQISFFEYLRDELTVTDFNSVQELKKERITNFLGVPASIEKLMGFGFFVCLDSFLYTFTILPLRFFLAFYHYLNYIYKNIQVILGQRETYVRLKSSQKCDLLKGLIICITCTVMCTFDPSRIYHSIRGQSVLKLYVVFNMLEIFDKLCSSVGVDLLDALFSKSTLGNSEQNSFAKRQLKPITFFIMATGYMICHTAVLFFQMITLNVAINFYSNALLSLLISNQIVEIKQSVFKRFEKENLFQLTCADIVERFQQYAFLFIITVRNIIDLSETGLSSILPSTFVPLFKLPATTSLNTLMTPVVMVIASELLVDWLKHAFITKFNQIRPSIYGKYIDLLCKDLVVGSPGRISGKHHSFVDQSPVVSRRIGFPVLPLACLYIRMMLHILPMVFMSHNDSSQSSELASMITNNLLTYLINHQDVMNHILPARIQLVVLSLVKHGWLENGLDSLFRGVLWILVILIIAILLLAVKVVVGIHLLGFAFKRFSMMEEKDQSVRDYLSKPEDFIMGEQPKKITLEQVDRFTMVKSRIP